jgi:hypothetical protein
MRGNDALQHSNTSLISEAIMHFKDASRGTSNTSIMPFHLPIQKCGASQPQTLVHRQGEDGGAGSSKGGEGDTQPGPHPRDPGTIIASPALSSLILNST